MAALDERDPGRDHSRKVHRRCAKAAAQVEVWKIIPTAERLKLIVVVALERPYVPRGLDESLFMKSVHEDR